MGKLTYHLRSGRSSESNMNRQITKGVIGKFEVLLSPDQTEQVTRER